MIENLLRLIKEKGITENKLQVACGFSGNQIYAWKAGKANPSMHALIKLADYFGVTIDSLVGREPPSTLTVPNEIAEIWNGFTDDDKDLALRYLRKLKNLSEEENSQQYKKSN